MWCVCPKPYLLCLMNRLIWSGALSRAWGAGLVGVSQVSRYWESTIWGMSIGWRLQMKYGWKISRWKVWCWELSWAAYPQLNLVLDLGDQCWAPSKRACQARVLGLNPRRTWWPWFLLLFVYLFIPLVWIVCGLMIVPTIRTEGKGCMQDPHGWHKCGFVLFLFPPPLFSCPYCGTCCHISRGLYTDAYMYIFKIRVFFPSYCMMPLFFASFIPLPSSWSSKDPFSISPPCLLQLWLLSPFSYSLHAAVLPLTHSHSSTTHYFIHAYECLGE